MKVPRAKTVNPAFDLQNHAANLAARDARAGQREKTIARLRAKLEKKARVHTLASRSYFSNDVTHRS